MSIFQVWSDTELVILNLGAHLETVVIFCTSGWRCIWRICFFLFFFYNLTLLCNNIHIWSILFHYKLIDFADIYLQLIVVAPRDKAISPLYFYVKIVSKWSQRFSHWKLFTRFIHVIMVITSISHTQKNTYYTLLNFLYVFTLKTCIIWVWTDGWIMNCSLSGLQRHITARRHFCCYFYSNINICISLRGQSS